MTYDTIIVDSHVILPTGMIDKNIIIDEGKIVGLTNAKIKSFKEAFIKTRVVKSKNGHFLNLEYKKKDDPRKDIFDFVVKNKLSLLEMSTQTANLEDIFRKLTK